MIDVRRVACAVFALVAAGGLTSGWSATAADAAAPAAQAIPAHVFAPYVETYAGGSLAQLATDSGAQYLTLAFLQTPAKGSCTVDWDGDPSTPVATAQYGADIARIRARGGDVIPSFGGYSADHDGTDIADSCTSVAKIAAAYEQVVTTYDVSRLDLDVEDRSLNRTAAISRRNAAIHLVQQWAARRGRTVQFSYTLPASMTGLDPTGVHVLSDALSQHADVAVVNAMAFDFYDGQPHEMGRDTVTVANAVIAQMHSVTPGVTRARLWSQLGITTMVGIDDFGPAETLTVADARLVERWATYHHLASRSFWASERDNGGCPGQAGSGDCSGIAQAPWQFSHIFEPFTRA